MIQISKLFAYLCSIALVSVYCQLPPSQPTLGTLDNGTYHNTLTGIEIKVLPAWGIVIQAKSPEPNADVIKLKDAASNLVATVWMKQRYADPANIEALMNGRLDAKTAQRNNFQNYRFRPESVLHTTVGGRPALSAVADYISAGQKMVEYVTWVDGEKSRVVFVGRVPVSQLAGFQSLFNPLIQSALVP